jgi:cobalt-zinc-cadmium resistance protein CzcA
LAQITEENGPNQIQRDDAKRRIIVAFNVRGRDVESIVKELQAKVSAQVKFGTGYYATYGGSYKNLEKAKERLAIAVPLALFLIIFLLFITFQDIKQAILIFSAIPLAAIGGVFALWLRDMPFSISAGVGFIALFGVAVLNGIVLVAAFNELRKRYPLSIYRVIILGTKQRLRPVLMTAMVASLGFLPMALSTGSGAEVQKPLATVVIGGLVTATFLTLFLLPILYSLIVKKSMKSSKKKHLNLVIILPLLGLSGSVFGQSTMTVEQCVDKALQLNPVVLNAKLGIEQAGFTARASVDIPQTEFSAMIGQYNSAEKNDNNFSIKQAIPFPTIFSKAKRFGREDEALQKLQALQIAHQLELSVRSTYDYLLYLTFREKQLGEALTSYKQVQSIVNFQAINGERSDLEAGLVSLSLIPLEQQLADLQREKVQTYQELQNLMFSTDTIILSESGYPFLLFQTATNNADSALLVRMEYQQTAKLDAEKALMKAQRLPLISVGYFNQTLIGTQNINGQDVSFTASDRFQGVQAGVSIPIFTRAENGRISQQELALKQAINTAEQRKLELLNRLSAIRSEWQILYDQQQLWVNNTLPTGLKVQDQLQFALEKGELTVDRILIQKEQWIQMQLLQLERIRLANVLLLEFNYLNQ